jgi:UDP-N-acetylmuramate dehydrogenase
MTLDIREHEPLAPLTTLELGGAARYFAEAASTEQILEAVDWAKSRGLPLAILGGGSNLLVPDEGVPGLVLAVRSRGIARQGGEGGLERVTAQAGEQWDDFVAATVADGLQGLETLAGIPGRVGATPVQNVGAYGHEVADTLLEVEVLEVATGARRTLQAAECGFGYRTSALKREGGRIVLSVTFGLRAGGTPRLTYAELQRAFEGRPAPDAAAVRETVLRLRRAKSMLVDPEDPNRRSAGSFFTNPVVPASVAAGVVMRAVEAGLAKGPTEVPQWPAPDGRVKLAAGWLIERSGIAKGMRVGNVGVSSAHALALVHHGGGSTRELLSLAERVVASVEQRFGVRLEREPVVLGGVAERGT